MDTNPTNQITDLATVDGLQWLEGVESLSALSPAVALNMPLAELVQATLAAAAGESENTARAYQTGIGLFLAWLDARAGDRLPEAWRPLAKATQQGKRTIWEFRGLAAVLRIVTAGLRDEFTAWRAAEGDGKTTQAIRRQAVNTFLRVAYRDGMLTADQALNLGLKAYARRQRRDVQPVGRRLKPDEVRQLRSMVTAARTERKNARDTALLDLMLFAGLRREEVAGLTTGNFRQDGGRWWLVVTGKGGKTRRVKVHDSLYRSLATWCKLAGVVLGVGADPLFCNLTKGGNPTGKALNAGVIGRIVAEYGHLAKLAPLDGENRLSPHDLRRTCARNAFDNGATLPQVQNMLGHADVKTTMLYIGSQTDDSNTAVDFVRY